MMIRRSMSPVFGGIENPLYYYDETPMLLRDARGFVGNIIQQHTGAQSKYIASCTSMEPASVQ